MLCKKQTSALPLAAILIFAAILTNNAFYGFGWTDEALYGATVHAMYQGNRMFFDIWEPTQSYELLLYPIHALYLLINKSTEGIYLYYRLIIIAIQTLTALFTYFVLNKKYTKAVSLISSIVMLVFSRASLFGPSYYAITLTTMQLTVLLIFAVFNLGWHTIALYPAGFFSAAAVLCNPYMTFPYIALSLLVLILPKTRIYYKKYLILWSGTITLAIVFLYAVLHGSDLSQFMPSLHYVFSSPEYSNKTTVQTVKWLLKFPRLLVTPFFYFLPFTLLAAGVVTKKIKINDKIKGIIPFLMLINYAAIFVYKRDNGGAAATIFHMAILLYLIHGKIDFLKYTTELIYFVIPGLSLAFMECLCSDTGFGVFAIGMVLLLPFSVFLLLQTDTGKTFKLLTLSFLVLSTLYGRVNFTYRDDRLSPHYVFIPALHKECRVITQGPAKGIYTGGKNKEQYDLIYASVKAIKAKNDSSIFISKLCPWAYLVNPDLKTNALSAWRINGNDLRIEPYYTQFDHKMPDNILFIDQAIRDNNDNHIDNSWLMSTLYMLDYSKITVPCGTLYHLK